MIEEPAKKSPKPNKHTGKAQSKKQPEENEEIPSSKLTEFVGHLKNLSHIDAHRLWDDYFRINAWTSTYGEGCVVRSSRIAKSFFVHYREGIIVDKTIQPEPIKEKFF
jgi:hypothetical protein